jgi:hypothetical protein
MSLGIPITRRRMAFRAHRLASQARIGHGRRLVGLHDIQGRGNMAKFGTERKPIIVRVQTEDRGAIRCAKMCRTWVALHHWS